MTTFRGNISIVQPPKEKRNTAGIVAAAIGAMLLSFLCCPWPGFFLVERLLVAGPERKGPAYHPLALECLRNLKSAYTGERMLFQEQHRYSDSPPEAGFAPERRNRYVYLFRSVGPVEDRSAATTTWGAGLIGVGVDSFRWPKLDTARLRALLPGHLAAELGVSGTCPACEVTVACIGDLDDDPDPDVWSISTKDRTAPGGARIDAGVPFNEVSDLR